MAYEPKPGSLTLFKNDRKEQANHPDYRGDGLDLAGNPVWVSAWIKEGAKGKFLSLSLKPKEQRQQDDFRGGGGVDRQHQGSVAGRGGGRESFAADLDDEIPFLTRNSIW